MNAKDVKPPYTALSAEPLTAGDVDEHEDSDRIWATIIDLWELHQKQLADAYRQGYEAGSSGRDYTC